MYRVHMQWMNMRMAVVMVQMIIIVLLSLVDWSDYANFAIAWAIPFFVDADELRRR